MSFKITHKTRIIFTFIFWAIGVIVFFGLSYWNFNTSKLDAENRLQTEAAHAAAQYAGIFSLPGIELNNITANAVINMAMDDERIYAIKLEAKNGIIEGQRRNYLWEPIPWDDELPDDGIRGMSYLKRHGRIEGKVEIWLSPRLNREENALLEQRELLRLGFCSLLWTIVFFILFWQCGDIQRLNKTIKGTSPKENKREEPGPEDIIQEFKEKEFQAQEKEMAEDQDIPIIDQAAARAYQKRNQDAWLVIAGMFGQTFARGPMLISRLYAAGETAGLCHLGRILEQAAPCVGAGRLAKAARDMQSALNNPDSQIRAMQVEECAKALEEVLDSLCGENTWRSKPLKTRSE